MGKSKEHLTDELADLRAQVAAERKRREQIRAAEVAVRARVAAMDEVVDLYQIGDEIRKELVQLGVDFDSVSLQMVNLSGTDFVSIPIREDSHPVWTHQVDKIADPSWEWETVNSEKFPWVTEVWRTGTPRTTRRRRPHRICRPV